METADQDVRMLKTRVHHFDFCFALGRRGEVVPFVVLIDVPLVKVGLLGHGVLGQTFDVVRRLLVLQDALDALDHLDLISSRAVTNSFQRRRTYHLHRTL